MQATLDDVVDHVLQSLFVVSKPLWSDEKEREEENIFFAHIKVGTLLSVHSVIITDYDVNVFVRFPFGSMSVNGVCGGCPSIEEKTCAAEHECPNTSAQFPLDLLATHCELWEPEIEVAPVTMLQ